MYTYRTAIEMAINAQELTITSTVLEREVTCTLLLPDNAGIEPLHLLLLNDGQEIENLTLTHTLENLYDRNCLKPVLIVAIHAGDDRIQEYGIAGQPDYKKRGSKANLYTQFIVTELLPEIHKATDIEHFESTAFAGFSLGGLTAMDIAWNNPELFDKVGAFSASFWWRSKDLSKGYTETDRLMHAQIAATEGKPALKFWLQTGTKDETADRNKNGIIDSIDDAIDIIKALEAKGYTRPADIQYLEVVGGSHDTETWGKAMPKFLQWAFGK
ncbi:alpha/beta hydrolase [Mucilaginibacter gilvus]|uniref:Esterase family protein n=1 Tax=Mucilaginibacter gilvus TaxID=2305909 RepID=A0A3S3US02_9SPHI|nr:alpha/beta hydrolase-fold protein [Mucilaginibacter gilvus]RWY49300.1 esterase family protein [Mucilaginibacter gilvus]